jgi:uncharacterized protein DUF3306
VPAELTRAALRRAWAADPQIRDFIGIAENQWDFTAPDGLYGFGQLGVEEARRLAAAILGGPDPVDPPADPAPMPGNAPVRMVSEGAPAASLPGESAAEINRDASLGVAAAVEAPPALPIVAIEKVGEAPEPAGKFMLRRTHGRALPE